MCIRKPRNHFADDTAEHRELQCLGFVSLGQLRNVVVNTRLRSERLVQWLVILSGECRRNTLLYVLP